MNPWNRRLALVAVLSAFAAPALAADPSQDCTVCKDPFWPKLENPMPPIPLNMPSQAPANAATSSDPAWLTAMYQSSGVGAAATTGAIQTGDAFTAPSRAAGIAVNRPDAPAPAKSAPKAAPGPAVAAN
jgi:hypothetical protein